MRLFIMLAIFVFFPLVMTLIAESLRRRYCGGMITKASCSQCWDRKRIPLRNGFLSPVLCSCQLPVASKYHNETAEINTLLDEIKIKPDPESPDKAAWLCPDVNNIKNLRYDIRQQIQYAFQRGRQEPSQQIQKTVDNIVDSAASRHLAAIKKASAEKTCKVPASDSVQKSLSKHKWVKLKTIDCDVCTQCGTSFGTEKSYRPCDGYCTSGTDFDRREEVFRQSARNKTTYKVEVSDSIKESMSKHIIDGNIVRLGKTLIRGDYLAVASVMKMLGGKWHRESRGFLFLGITGEQIASKLIEIGIINHQRFSHELSIQATRYLNPNATELMVLPQALTEEMKRAIMKGIIRLDRRGDSWPV